MNVTEMGRVGLTGWRGKVGRGVARPVSSVTGLRQEQVEALIGAAFLALAVYQFASLIARLTRAGRDRELPD